MQFLRNSRTEKMFVKLEGNEELIDLLDRIEGVKVRKSGNRACIEFARESSPLGMVIPKKKKHVSAEVKKVKNGANSRNLVPKTVQSSAIIAKSCY